MTDFRLYDFNLEVECLYGNEQYSVRDNGAVLRHPRKGKRLRPADNQWTFGKTDSKKGYLHIAGVVIHRIVATAFHGHSPTKEYVVDHIDTNRRNNRPENLRWLTRLENILKNPITMKRIELICGTVEAFLDNPSLLGNSKFDRNFEWMRTVSPEEAKSCKERLVQWSKSNKIPSGGSLGDWVYKPVKSNYAPVTSVSFPDCHTTKATNETQCASSALHAFSYPPSKELIPKDESNLIASLTPGVAQRKWKTPTEFPCCPSNVGESPLKTYAEKLHQDAVFSRNNFSTTIVLESAIAEDSLSILVINQEIEANAIKPWSIAKITHEDGLYVHEGCGTFFTLEGAQKQFCLEQGFEWPGGDNTLTFDELCG